MSTPRIANLIVLAFAASVATAQSIQLAHGQIVQAAGDPVAALPGATVVASSPFDSPAIDLNGNMVWRARLAGGPVTGTLDDRALFFGRTADDMQLVMRSGDIEPSGTMPGVQLYQTSSSSGAPLGSGVPSNYRISAQGNFIMLGCGLYGPGIVATGTTLAGNNNSALYWGPIGNLFVLAKRGDFAPSGGSQYDTAFLNISLQNTSLNSSGTALFKQHLVGGDVVGNTNDDAWIIGTFGGLNWMCREGDDVLGDGSVVGTIGFQGQLNENGQVLHDETLSTTAGSNPATTADNAVLMIYTPGSGHAKVMRKGDLAPGTPGCKFGSPSLSSNCFARSGFTVFATNMTDGDVTGTTDDGAIFVGTPGNLALVARESMACPSGDPTETYNVIASSNMTVNSSGVVAFQATIAGPSVTTATDMALWYGTAGNVQPVAREGMAAAGMPAGYIIGNSGGTAISNGTTILLNDLGQLQFSCSVWDGVTPATGVTAFYTYDPNLGLLLTGVAGETFTIAGQPQVLTNINTIGNNSGDGSPMSFNNNGDFCTRSFFTGTVTSAIVRGHVGHMQASPSSIPAAGGTQSWEIDAGVANAGQFYVIAGTLSGSRPGFSILGAHMPLNHDVWFDLSLSAANGAVYTNSWGLLDGSGKASASFNFPPGFTYFQGAMIHHAVMVLNPSPVTPLLTSEPTSVHLY